MKLYFSPGTCALAPHILLNWVGADYEAQQVEMNSAAYKKINPSGAVPALDSGDGRVKTQAGSILKYLSDIHPEAGLGADNNAESKFELDETMSFLTGDFHPAFWPFFGPTAYTTSRDKTQLEHVKSASFLLIDRVMTKLDTLIEANNGHVALGRRTIADPYAFAMSRWANYLPKKVSDYPHIYKFHENMLKDAGVKSALEAHGANL